MDSIQIVIIKIDQMLYYFNLRITKMGFELNLKSAHKCERL